MFVGSRECMRRCLKCGKMANHPSNGERKLKCGCCGFRWLPERSSLSWRNIEIHRHELLRYDNIGGHWVEVPGGCLFVASWEAM